MMKKKRLKKILELIKNKRVRVDDDNNVNLVKGGAKSDNQ